ncbi:hypothetical protein [Antrihabitans spumae]|uniref:Uncharacterized protein n=1 Tax=Antrihabitans spumae TaxID=3373370 RepID=A0ABW7KCT9_9NOCA
MTRLDGFYIKSALTTIMAVVVTVAFLLSACSNEATTPITTPALGGGATASDNPETVATEQALAAVTRYFQVLSRLDADATTSLNEADAVAAGQVLETAKADVTVRARKVLSSQGISLWHARKSLRFVSRLPRLPKSKCGSVWTYRHGRRSCQMEQALSALT